MRMIHHHPTLVKHPIEEALTIHEQILSMNSNYASPSVAIMYDLTLKNYERAILEYKKYIDIPQSHKSENVFWLYEIDAVKLLIGSLENLLEGKPNSCDHPHFNEVFARASITSIDETRFFCEAIILTNTLRGQSYNETSVKEFLINNRDNYLKVFDLHYRNITGLTIASNLLAGKDPSFALELLQEESKDSMDASYAVGDFQMEALSQLNEEFNSNDFLPSECLSTCV
jgi:hypothetical protein